MLERLLGACRGPGGGKTQRDSRKHQGQTLRMDRGRQQEGSSGWDKEEEKRRRRRRKGRRRKKRARA